MWWFLRSPFRVFSTLTILLYGGMLCGASYHLGWMSLMLWLFFGGGGLLVFFSPFLDIEAMTTRSWKVFIKGYPKAIKTFWQEFKR